MPAQCFWGIVMIPHMSNAGYRVKGMTINDPPIRLGKMFGTKKSGLTPGLRTKNFLRRASSTRSFHLWLNPSRDPPSNH